MTGFCNRCGKESEELSSMNPPKSGCKYAYLDPRCKKIWEDAEKRKRDRREARNKSK